METPVKYKRYVVGLLFKNYQGLIKQVALILKNRGPYNMANKLNGIGGKIEPGETASAAMEREFREETGVSIKHWNEFLELRGHDWIVHFFRTEGDYSIRTTTDEKVDWYSVNHILQYGSYGVVEIMPNLKWIIPMALDPDIDYANVIDGSYGT